MLVIPLDSLSLERPDGAAYYVLGACISAYDEYDRCIAEVRLNQRTGLFEWEHVQYPGHVHLYAVRLSSCICSPNELKSKLKRERKMLQTGVMTRFQDASLREIEAIAHTRGVK